MRHFIVIALVFLATGCSTSPEVQRYETPEAATLDMVVPTSAEPVCDAAWCGEWGYCCNSHNTACTRCALSPDASAEQSVEGVDMLWKQTGSSDRSRVARE